MAQQNSTEAPQFVFFTNNSGAVVVNLKELVFVKNVKNGSALHFRDASELLVTETAEDVQVILHKIFGDRPEFTANENTGNPRPAPRDIDPRGRESYNSDSPRGEERHENSRENRGGTRGRRFHKTDAFGEDNFTAEF